MVLQVPPAFSLPSLWSLPFLQKALVPFNTKWYLEAKTRALGGFTAVGCCYLQACLSVYLEN